MPSYYNPYNFFPATYMQQPVQQSYANVPQAQPNMSGAQGVKIMEWVEGEVGAKAFQMPPGLPVNQPIPLWDTTDTNVFLKSWGPMGIPNPLRKLHYTEQNMQYLLSGNNVPASATDAAAPQPAIDTSNFVTKDELDEIRSEVRSALSGMNRPQNRPSPNQNQNGSSGNRGGAA